jgi:hypothetical protein
MLKSESETTQLIKALGQRFLDELSLQQAIIEFWKRAYEEVLNTKQVEHV